MSSFAGNKFICAIDSSDDCSGDIQNYPPDECQHLYHSHLESEGDECHWRCALCAGNIRYLDEKTDFIVLCRFMIESNDIVFLKYRLITVNLYLQTIFHAGKGIFFSESYALVFFGEEKTGVDSSHSRKGAGNSTQSLDVLLMYSSSIV